MLEFVKIREKRFDKQFLKDNLRFGNSLGKIYLCGPRLFVDEIYSSLSPSVSRS